MDAENDYNNDTMTVGKNPRENNGLADLAGGTYGRRIPKAITMAAFLENDTRRPQIRNMEPEKTINSVTMFRTPMTCHRASCSKQRSVSEIEYGVFC